MRHARTLVPTLVTTVALAVGGSAVALAGPTAASSSVASSASTADSPVAGLLAGSYRSDFGRLSVGGKSTVDNEDAPSISGRSRLGRTVTVTSGSWKPAKVRTTYRWLADGKKIAGAKQASYSPDASVVGSLLSVRVTAHKKGYRSASVVEEAGRVTGGRISSSTAPKLRGPALVGKRLRVTAGRWSVAGVSLAYEWRSGRSVVSTSKRYVAKRSDLRKTLRVTVTATKAGYRAGKATVRSPKIKR